MVLFVVITSTSLLDIALSPAMYILNVVFKRFKNNVRHCVIIVILDGCPWIEKVVTIWKKGPMSCLLNPMTPERAFTHTSK